MKLIYMYNLMYILALLDCVSRANAVARASVVRKDVCSEPMERINANVVER